jgi:hypothetical protein
VVESVEWEAVVKVYQDLEEWMSLGIKRVHRAVQMYAPADIEFVNTEEEADLIIVHTVGNGQRSRRLEMSKPYAVIQYCLRTTELPDTKDWINYWEDAQVVWSYYDLLGKILEDGGDARADIEFYHAPLGVESKIFLPSFPIRKRFLIGTSGYVAETEGVIEAHAVCEALGRTHFHLGPDLKLGTGVTYITNVTDEVLAEFWSQCTFVAGLRAIEGFELPVIEGLMCGARPIIYDKPHYTHWFGEYSEIIPEGSREVVTEALMSIMSKPVRPVTAAERSQVAATFDWDRIVKGFWERVR